MPGVGWRRFGPNPGTRLGDPFVLAIGADSPIRLGLPGQVLQIPAHALKSMGPGPEGARPEATAVSRRRPGVPVWIDAAHQNRSSNVTISSINWSAHRIAPQLLRLMRGSRWSTLRLRTRIKYLSVSELEPRVGREDIAQVVIRVPNTARNCANHA